MKKQINYTLIICFLSGLFSCNYILHPSKYYDYSNNRISKARNSNDFKAIRKELHIRAVWDVTHDYFRVPKKLAAPSDTVDFRKYTEGLVLARLSSLNIDSIKITGLASSDSLSISKGSGEYMIAVGIIFWHKGKTQKWGFFNATWIPGTSSDIIQMKSDEYFTRKD